MPHLPQKVWGQASYWWTSWIKSEKVWMAVNRQVKYFLITLSYFVIVTYAVCHIQIYFSIPEGNHFYKLWTTLVSNRWHHTAPTCHIQQLQWLKQQLVLLFIQVNKKKSFLPPIDSKSGVTPNLHTVHVAIVQACLFLVSSAESDVNSATFTTIHYNWGLLLQV